MATITAPARHLSLTVALLIAALFIGAVGTTIWLSIDNNAGTNSLATDGR